jgi:hypothetical protein
MATLQDTARQWIAECRSRVTLESQAPTYVAAFLSHDDNSALPRRNKGPCSRPVVTPYDSQMRSVRYSLSLRERPGMLVA